MSRTFPQQETDEIVKAKVQLHLRLTYEDWTETFKQLKTRSELGVLFAIRTLDPFGDRALDIDCTALGEELGLHRTTVSDALKLLSEKKLIDVEITKARVKQKISNRRLTLLKPEENESNQEKNEEKTMRVSALTSECGDSQVSVETHSGGARLTSECGDSHSSPEPLPAEDSKNPHTLTDFSNVSKTLSDSERENFEKFCQRKIEKLPKMPANPKAYIRKYKDDLYAEFQEQEAKRKEVDEIIQASKEQPAEKAPLTAAHLHRRWLVKGWIRKDAIEKALELGFVVTPSGIFDPSEDPSGGKSSGGGHGG